MRRIDGHDNWSADGSGMELSASDSLFAMLDGQIIRGRQAAWRAEVVSIVTDGPETWVQVGRAGSPGSTVVLRMDRQRRAGEALDALRDWTDIPEDSRPGRIELVCSDEQRWDEQRRDEQRWIERQPVFRDLPWRIRTPRHASARHN